jgi:hypothetical protein
MASMNSNIILAGQPIDIVGSMARGTQAAGQALQLRDQNALRNVYQTQGAGLLSGDPGAYNALAAIDPNAAIGMRNGNLEGQYTQRRMEILNADEKRQIADAARAMSDQQKAEALEATKREVFRFISAPTPEIFDQLVTQAGKPELAGQWANRQMLGSDYVSSVEEAIKLSAGPAAPDLQDRYKVAGGTLFDLGAEGGPRPIGQGAMQEETVFGPDGKPILQRGGPGTYTKFTEAQSKDTAYATRAEGAIAAFEPVANALTSYSENVMEGVPFNLARGLQTDEFQKARQSGRELLAVLLRKDTGAAVTEPEEKMYGEVFLPQPGDGKPVLEQKKIARARAVEALKSGMGPDQILAMGRALMATDARTGAQPAATAGDAVIPPEAADMLRGNPTPEFRASFDEIFGPGAASRILGGGQ